MEPLSLPPLAQQGRIQGWEHRAMPSREEPLVQREPTRTAVVVRPRCASHRTILLFASAFP